MAKFVTGIVVASFLSFADLHQNANAQDSPGDALKYLQKGFAKNAWADAVKSLSPGAKKGFVFECLHSSIFLQEPAKTQFDELFKKAGFTFEEAAKKAETIGNKDYIDVMLSSVEDEDQFLTKLYSIVFGFVSKSAKLSGQEYPPPYHGKMKDLNIEQERARAILEMRVKNGFGGEIEAEQPIFFRKYEGKWKFCLEAEWKDKDYKVDMSAIR